MYVSMSPCLHVSRDDPETERLVTRSTHVSPALSSSSSGHPASKSRTSWETPPPPQVVVVSGNPPDSFSPGVEVTVSEDEEGEGLLLTCSATGRWGIQSSI